MADEAPFTLVTGALLAIRQQFTNAHQGQASPARVREINLPTTTFSQWAEANLANPDGPQPTAAR